MTLPRFRETHTRAKRSCRQAASAQQFSIACTRVRINVFHSSGNEISDRTKNTLRKTDSLFSKGAISHPAMHGSTLTFLFRFLQILILNADIRPGFPTLSCHPFPHTEQVSGEHLLPECPFRSQQQPFASPPGGSGTVFIQSACKGFQPCPSLWSRFRSDYSFLRRFCFIICILALS